MSEPTSVLIRAAGLWERTSAKGKRYLAGRCGGIKLIAFENAKRGQEGEPDWTLFFGEAPPWKGPEQKQPARAQEPHDAELFT